MTTPLAATGRIYVPYTIDGLAHHLFAYVRNPQLVGGVYQINSRTTDANDTTFAHAADGLIEAMTYLHSTSVAYGDAVLQLLVSGVWNPVASHTFAGTSHLTGTGYIQGLQSTLTLRDVDFNKVRVIVMEANFGGASKSVTTSFYGDARDTFIKQWTSVYTLTYAPYLWQVGRGNHYLQTSPLVSYIQAFNRKLRRARGIA
jgi:hypothetical protein